MEKICWNSSYSVGLDILDNQHQQIIRVINYLIEHVDAEPGSEPITEALTMLTQYAQVHFKTEEKILSKANYPQLRQHKEEHSAYRLKIANFCLPSSCGKSTENEEILFFIRNWWNEHILVSDMEYRDYLKKSDISYKPTPQEKFGIFVG